MDSQRNTRISALLAAFCLALDLCASSAQGQIIHPSRSVTQGTLVLLDREGQPAGECPLKHTSVRAEITGFFSRVTVTQEFENRSAERIEAVYTFPLPQHAAVDQMEIHVGERTIRGIIRRREEARRIYEQARERGHLAALLDQERPNIFTQSVANIAPGENVRIRLSYVEILRYEEGIYEFVFPMVVGPRYIPGQPTGRQGGGWAADTHRVPDASRITPPVTPPGTRAGHDIDIEVHLDAGFPISRLDSVSHEIQTERKGLMEATLRLRNSATLPNKDFILRYDMGKNQIQDTLLLHRSRLGGYFTLILQPPERPREEEITPKELVFVLDTSGSMQGFPIEKAKETMRLALAGLYSHDTFNLITFSGDTKILFPHPVPATSENLRQAYEFMESQRGGGGTEMMKAIRTALESSGESGVIRIVCFMTDGYVGNDMEIVAEVRKHPAARIFSFGIGNSVNRFLLDAMAREGRGAVEYVSLKEDGSTAAQRFHQRIRQPLLTDIRLDCSWMPVKDIHPIRLPDLFSAQPLVITGRFTGTGRGVLRLTGQQGKRTFERTIPVEFPGSEPRHPELASWWARTRIEDLSAQDWLGMQTGSLRPELREEITQLGLEFNILTPFTSFVAVEERTVTVGGNLRQVQVPVELPEGTDYNGIFGADKSDSANRAAKQQAFSPGGYVGGVMASIVGGVGSGAKPEVAIAPPPVLKSSSLSMERDERRKIKDQLGDQIRLWIEQYKSGKLSGEVEVEIWLSEPSPEILAQLKRLGFRSTRETPEIRRLIGRLPVSQLEILSKLPQVLRLAPAPKK